MGHDGNLDGSVAIIVIIDFFGTPYGVPLLTGFVVLQREESRLIKSTKTFLCNIPLLRSEEIKYIVWLQQLMFGEILLSLHKYMYFYY